MIESIYKFFKRLMNQTCIICSLPIQTESYYLCKKCEQGLQAYDNPHKISKDLNIVVLFPYNDYSQDLLLQIKNYDREKIINFLAEKFAQLIEDNVCLVAVPTHRKKLFQRGYNVPSEICKAIVRIKPSAQFCPFVLQKTKNTTQASQDLISRTKNAETIILNDFAPIIGENCYIVDDLMASGATIKQCVALLEPFAKTIKVLLVAKS